MSADSRTLLIVEDDTPLRDRLVRAMSDRGYEARGVADHASALNVAREESPELALVDLRLPGESGLTVIRELKELDPATIVVVLKSVCDAPPGSAQHRSLCLTVHSPESAH